MKIEVEVSDVKQLGTQLGRSGSEIAGINSDLRREMGRLSLRSQGRAEVDQAYKMIQRALQEVEQGLERYSRGVTKKGEDFKEADGKAPAKDWSKAWGYIKMGVSIGLDFVPIVGNVKGVIEAVVGRDLITGAKLTWWERGLAVLGPFGKGASKGAKLLKFADEAVGGITKFGKTADKLIPALNNGKGGLEALLGRDLITGEKLAPWQRMLALAGAGSVMNKGTKMLGFADEAVDMNKKMKQVDRFNDAVAEGSKKKDKLADAGDAISDQKRNLDAVAAGTAGGTTIASMLTNKKGGKAADEVAATGTKTFKEGQISQGKPTLTSAEINQSQVKQQSKISDPIHAGTGHQFMSHAILKLYGAATWKIELQYNSGLVQRSSLGLAWTHNYDMKLTFGEEGSGEPFEQHMPVLTSQVEASIEGQIDSVGNATGSLTATSPNFITVWWNAGRHNVFVRGEDGVYRGKDCWVTGNELTQGQDGYILKLRQSRERYFFTKSGQLVRHETASGLLLEASYDEKGNLAKLQDVASGRAFQFHYEEKSLGNAATDDVQQHTFLTSITSGERQVQFEYASVGWLAAYTDANGHVTSFTCDDYGHILTMATGDNLDFSNTYDADYRIIEQLDAKGNPTTLSYDTTSRPGYTITTVTNRVNKVSKYIHDENQLLVQVCNPAGEIETYCYNEQGQEIEHKNAVGEVQRRFYDGRGRLTQIEDALGHTTSYEHNEQDLLVKEVDAQGGMTTYDYDEAQRLVQITRPDGTSCTMTYHATGQLATYTDYAGAITTYHYGSDGVISGVEDAEGILTSLIQDKEGRITGVRDSLGGYTERKYDSLDQLVKVTDPLGRTWNYTYDAYGQIIRQEAPDGATTNYTYTSMGQVATISHPLGQVETYLYDEEDRLIAHENECGGITKLTYDHAGRVLQVIDPLDRTVSYIYDTGGRVTHIQDALGQTVQSLQYDTAGRVTTITNGLGHAVKRRWNELNQIIAQTEADGVETTYHYDSLARLQKVVQGDGDAVVSLPQSVRDILGAMKMPTSLPAKQGEKGATYYEQSYDAEHRVTSYRDGNGYETKFSYDQSGHLLQEKNASGSTLQYRYDARGWLAERENARGQTQQYTYDASGQPTTLQDEASQIELTYDTAGRWIHSKEGIQEMHRSYDVMGRVTQQQEVWGHKIGYQYDVRGNLTHLTYPDGKVVEYRYNLAGELTEVKDWTGRLTRYRYDANGRLIEQHRPNGSKEKRRYNAIGQIMGQQDATAQGVLLQQFTYQYNEAGQLIKEQDKQYSYDRFRRLVSGVDQGKITYYEYDRGGNLTALGQQGKEGNGTLHASSSQLSYGADNRIAGMNGYPVEMDADGNLVYVTDGEQMGAYEYDSRNRLIQSGRMKYRYNWRNERIECIWRGKVTRYVVDDVGPLSRVLMEMDEAGEPIARYVYGLGLIGVEDGRSGAYQSYHQDLRGSTTLLTDEKGRVTDRYTYGIYGELVQHEGRTAQPFQYNGQDGVMHDPNGLYYMRARYYHTGLKRFLNRDVVKGTVVEGQTLNRYAYVNGDPVSYVDPLGLSRDSKGTENTSRADFYVAPNGTIIPSTGYRYISKDATYLDDMKSTMTIPANPSGTYFSFDKFDTANPQALQVPHDASVRVSFDTLQLEDIRVPYGQWGKASWLEPITRDFPDFGSGGATQVITNQTIKIDTIDFLPEK